MISNRNIKIFSLSPGIWLKGFIVMPFIAGSMMAATARWIILAKYTNEKFDSRYRATAISALSMGVGIVYVIITAISGPIIANFGGVRTIYTLLGRNNFFSYPFTFSSSNRSRESLIYSCAARSSFWKRFISTVRFFRTTESVRVFRTIKRTS